MRRRAADTGEKARTAAPWILRKEDTEANFKKHIMGWTRRADIYRVIAGDPKLNSKSEKPSCTSDLSSIWAHKPGTAQKSQFSKPKNNMMGWTRRADISWGITGDPKLNTKSEKPSCTLDLGTLVFSTLLKFTTVRAHSAPALLIQVQIAPWGKCRRAQYSAVAAAPNT